MLSAACLTENHFVVYTVVYSGATNDVVDPLLYQGFVEELVEVLEMKQDKLHVSSHLYEVYCTHMMTC